MNKDLIAKNFGKAANSYNSVATIQALAAEELASLINFENISSILDIGCGTGNASLELYKKYPNASYTLCDISQNMLDIAANSFPKEVAEICCDAENYDFPYHDLVISNLCMQWFQDINTFIEKIAANCKNCAFSTLLDGSFESYKELFDMPPTFAYKTTEDLLEAITFEKYKTEEYQIEFKNFFGVARYFRRLGANMRPTSLRNNLKLDYGPIIVNYKIFFGVV